MKRQYLLLIFVLSFFICFNVKADYKATVLNPSGASCNLRSGSTGYCYYNSASLNSYTPNVVWLDTGDEVTVIESKAKVDSPNKNLCSDYYVYTSYHFIDKPDIEYYGYYCNANLSVGSALTDDLKNEFKNLGFPESYWEKLAILKKAHPNWTFTPLITGLNFNDAVSNENIGSRSLIQGSGANNYAYLALDYGAFDYINDDFVPYDNTTASWDSRWYRANSDTIAYYMDPRNFLLDMYIFQFQGLSYDSSFISKEDLKKIIESAYGSGSLIKFADSFIEAGEKSKVDPIYLTALSIQEVGVNGGTATSGNYNGMYNFYNIGATGGENPVVRGLEFAANSQTDTLRPWNTPEKAIIGGAIWIGMNYINFGQNTSYFKRFNVVYNYIQSKGEIKNPYSNYSHQYMTNIKAPSSEAKTTYGSYYKNNLLNLKFNFIIPVYNNMPNSTALPTKSGWPNNYLKEIKINGTKIADFDPTVTTYNYYQDINNEKVVIESSPKNSTAKISGNGTFTVSENSSKVITVTAQNGDIKKYTLNIILTGTKHPDPVDVLTTLNNTDIKNNDKYLSGFTVGSDISVTIQKIKNVRNDAVVTFKKYNGEGKTSGVISTGDKVTIKVGEDIKEYEVIVYADVNGDGKIAASDYVLIKNNIMGKNTLSGCYKEAADVNRDNKVAASDYVKIKNQIMGKGTISQ